MPTSKHRVKGAFMGRRASPSSAPFVKQVRGQTKIVFAKSGGGQGPVGANVTNDGEADSVFKVPAMGFCPMDDEEKREYMLPEQTVRPKATLHPIDELLFGFPFNPVWLTFDKDPRVAPTHACPEVSPICEDASKIKSPVPRFTPPMRILANRVHPTREMLIAFVQIRLGISIADARRSCNRHVFRNVDGGIETKDCNDEDYKEEYKTLIWLVKHAKTQMLFVMLPKLVETNITDARVNAMAESCYSKFEFSNYSIPQRMERAVYIMDSSWPLFMEPVVFSAACASYEPSVLLGAVPATPPDQYRISHNDDLKLLFQQCDMSVRRLPKRDQLRTFWSNTSALFAYGVRQFIFPCHANVDFSDSSVMFQFVVHNLRSGVGAASGAGNVERTEDASSSTDITSTSANMTCDDFSTALRQSISDIIASAKLPAWVTDNIQFHSSVPCVDEQVGVFHHPPIVKVNAPAIDIALLKGQHSKMRMQRVAAAAARGNSNDSNASSVEVGSPSTPQTPSSSSLAVATGTLFAQEMPSHTQAISETAGHAFVWQDSDTSAARFRSFWSSNSTAVDDLGTMLTERDDYFDNIIDADRMCETSPLSFDGMSSFSSDATTTVAMECQSSSSGVQDDMDFSADVQTVSGETGGCVGGGGDGCSLSSSSYYMNATSAEEMLASVLPQTPSTTPPPPPIQQNIPVPNSTKRKSSTSATNNTFYASAMDLLKIWFLVDFAKRRAEALGQSTANLITIEQNLVTVRGIGVFVEEYNAFGEILPLHLAKCKDFLETADAAVSSRVDYDGDSPASKLRLYNYRSGLFEQWPLPSKCGTAAVQKFVASMSSQPLTSYIADYYRRTAALKKSSPVAAAGAVTTTTRKLQRTLSTSSSTSSFTTSSSSSAVDDDFFDDQWVSKHRMFHKTCALSGAQHEQLLDAYYWSHLAPERMQEYGFIVQFYRNAGMSVRTKNEYQRTGSHSGRCSASGMPRNYAPHRKHAYSQLSSFITTDENGNKSAIARNARKSKSKYLDRLRQQHQNPFSYNPYGVVPEDEKLFKREATEAQQRYLLKSVHHRNKPISEVLGVSPSTMSKKRKSEEVASVDEDGEAKVESREESITLPPAEDALSTPVTVASTPSFNIDSPSTTTTHLSSSSSNSLSSLEWKGKALPGRLKRRHEEMVFTSPLVQSSSSPSPDDMLLMIPTANAEQELAEPTFVFKVPKRHDGDVPATTIST